MNASVEHSVMSFQTGAEYRREAALNEFTVAHEGGTLTSRNLDPLAHIGRELEVHSR
jgi:hypothetical protein